jgi:hypothetical protein
MRYEMARKCANALLAKARVLVDMHKTRKHFERIIHEMESTANMTIFDYDCVSTIPRVGKRGPDGWSAVVAKQLGGSVFIPFEIHNTEDQNHNTRAFFVSHPPSLGKPRKTYHFLMDNKMNFTRIWNINDLLIQVVDVMQESYYKKIPINPFQSFLLELPAETTRETVSTAKLAMCIPNSKAIDLDSWVASAHNVFLSIFLGHNFWENVLGNRVLEEKVLKYHTRMVEDKKRE